MGRCWVIPDVHGYLRTLRSLVSDRIQPGKEDKLIFLGDYIDRGPDSKGVIDFIRSLQENVCQVTALKGNHEDMMVEIYDAARLIQHRGVPTPCRYEYSSWVAMGARTTLESFRVDSITKAPVEYIEWMRHLSHFVQDDRFVMLHAGLNFRNPDPFADLQAMLWIREFESAPERIGRRRIIHGHVPVYLDRIQYTVSDPDCQSLDLDNGIYLHAREGLGNLVALELSTIELTVQRNMDI